MLTSFVFRLPDFINKNYKNFPPSAQTIKLSCSNTGPAKRAVCIAMKYYNRQQCFWKFEMLTHPVRKNMAARVLKRVFGRYCLQARPYLLQRGGCGQCWEALLMGWLVLALGLCGMVVIVSGSLGCRKHLALCRKPVPVRGYNKNTSTWAPQSQFYRILPNCQDLSAHQWW